MKHVFTLLILLLISTSCEKSRTNKEIQGPNIAVNSDGVPLKAERDPKYKYNAEGQPIDKNGMVIDTTTLTPQTYSAPSIPVETESYKIEDSGGTSTLYKLSKIFVNNPSENEIERYMNKALDTYGLERTDENYNRVGSVLVDLRMNSDKDITEMQILKYTIKIHTKNTKITDMMAMASVFLEN